jgi:hypothetical protein
VLSGLDGVVLLEVGGVGYQVVVPDAAGWADVGAALYVHHPSARTARAVRLCGARTGAFQVLIHPRRGPALAMAILRRIRRRPVDIVAGGVRCPDAVPASAEDGGRAIELKAAVRPVLDPVGGRPHGAIGDVASLAGLGYGPRRSARPCASCRPIRRADVARRLAAGSPP